MKSIFLLLIISSLFAVSCFAQENSYEKDWILQERAEAKRLAAGGKLGSGDRQYYPSRLMKLGRGFANGLAKVTLKGKAGFINADGRIIIKTKFVDAGRFSENLAPVEVESGKWGFINRRGEWAIKPQFDWAFSFRDERALVQVGEKWGYIDTSGNYIVQPQFDAANSFSDGVAAVRVWRPTDVAGYPKDYKILKSGYINKSGKWIIQQQKRKVDYSAGS